MKKVKRYQTGGLTGSSSPVSAFGMQPKSGASAGIDQIAQGVDAVDQSMSAISNALGGNNAPGSGLNAPSATSQALFKKGGKVKMSSASKRGDGCAIKGKTRGRIV
jgi:hypothetical protein